MREFLFATAIMAFLFMWGREIYMETKSSIQNIEHDGHLFIQSKTGLIHHPACSCQSSLKAIRASQP